VLSSPSFPLYCVCVIARTSFRNPAESGVGSKQLLSFVAVQRRCPSYSVTSSKLARSIKSLTKVISLTRDLSVCCSVCNGAVVLVLCQSGRMFSEFSLHSSRPCCPCYSGISSNSALRSTFY
jgi:hypothetical protein